jgi:large subunit ribosomal protein LP2
MKELALYLLLTLGGKTADAAGIKGAADAAGIAVDDEAVSTLLAAVEGKDLNEIVEAGRKKLVNIGGGGAAPAAAGAAAPAGGAAEKKEEKKKEEEPEEEVGGAGGLFGGDDDDW